MDGDRTASTDAGVVGTFSELATQVKPPFMVPAVATAGFGALLAPSLAPLPALLHVFCVSLALYVAHLRDEHVDAHVRGEEQPTVPTRLLGVATVVGTGAFLLSLGGMWRLTGPLATGATLPLLLLAFLHAPFLDTNPVTVSLDYPVAIGLVIVGGYAAQTGAAPGWIVWVAGSFVFVLAGATVTLDRLDRTFDARIGKRTVPVVLGDAGAALVAATLVIAGGLVVFVAVGVSVLPPAAALAGIVPLATARGVARADAERAVRIQMIATYPFAGLLFLSTCLGVDCVVARFVLG